MKRFFEQFAEGEKLYVVYNKEENKDLPDKWTLTHATILKNYHYDHTEDVRDRYDYEPVYVTYHEYRIKFIVNGIHNTVFERKYSESYNKSGHMNCCPEGLYRERDIWVDVFTEYEDAKAYLLEICNDRAAREEKTIKAHQAQLDEYRKSIETYIDVDESTFNKEDQ